MLREFRRFLFLKARLAALAVAAHMMSHIMGANCMPQAADEDFHDALIHPPPGLEVWWEGLILNTELNARYCAAVACALALPSSVVFK